jgi:cell division septation protein DedD
VRVARGGGQTLAGTGPTAFLTMVALAGLAAFGTARPDALAAQRPTLERVDSLIAAADYETARATIEAWAARRSDRMTGAQQARGLMLRAQLAGSPAEAEPHYLAIILGYPVAPEAPRALLRLGQGLLVAGEPARAVGYLQRFVADYPGHPERTMGLLWLARARTAARESPAGCAAARQGLADTRDPDLVAMLRVEEDAACATATGRQTAQAAAPTTSAPAPGTTSPPPPTTPPSTPTPARPTPARPATTPPAAAGTGRFSAQVGAFRQQQSIDDIVARLRRAGYEPRVAMIPGSSLIRVRVGRFTTAGDAARMVARLKEGRFDAVVVGDANQERAP